MLIANSIYHLNSSWSSPDKLNSLWPKQTFCHPQILSLRSGITSISLAVKCSATYHKDSFLWYLRCLWLWECRNSFWNQWINGTKTIETTNWINIPRRCIVFEFMLRLFWFSMFEIEIIYLFVIKYSIKFMCSIYRYL